MKVRTVYIIIGCDTDPDRAGFLDGVPADGLSWRGMTEGIPRLKESVVGLTDHRGREPAFTWLLRVDEQINQIHGAYNWVLSTQRSFLFDLEAGGDELGWHPHFWLQDPDSKKWYQETADIDWQTGMLRAAHRAFMEVFPERARSVRMGWDFHNNHTINTLDELGVTVDFSALPGMRTQPAEKPGRGENLFDWYRTPRAAYHPSQKDYRRPPKDDETSLALWEAPAFVSRSFIWGLVSGLQMARKMKAPGQLWQAIRRPTYWINLTGRPALFEPLATQLRKTLRRTTENKTFFVTYFHPDELLENKSSIYSHQSVRANLETLLHICDAQDVAVEFTRAEQIPELMDQDNIEPA